MSAKIPDFRFLYSSDDGKTRVLNSADLETPILMSRDEPNQTTSHSVTYGAYMAAIKVFILENFEEFRNLVLEKIDSSGEIALIDLVAEKRGADYYPSSVRAHAGNDQIWFAANVALTERGLSRIRQDYDLLKFLGSMGSENFVPEVFFINKPPDPSASIMELPNIIFLAEWFRGYHEFHVSSSTTENQCVFTLWDTDNGYYEFSETLAVQVIEKIAYILSYFFDPADFREIYPWHHAAGDFIAKLHPASDVKLITVRQYQSRVSFPENSTENRNEALLIFFANLSVRARVDRINGVGELVWMDKKFVRPVIHGFLKAMMSKERERDHNQKFSGRFIKMLGNQSIEEWAGLFVQVLESHDERAPDFQIIKDHLVDHIFYVYQNCQSLTFVDEIHL